ncbi:MAG: hypothetical protein GXY44_07160 [Phycisphaerales bacterium]|nr:hypothetical protein [Phycisphaerales bacterium]
MPEQLADTTLCRDAFLTLWGIEQFMEMLIVKNVRRKAVNRVLVLLSVLGLFSLGFLCQPPYRYVLRDADGQSIEITAVAEIASDPDLSQDEKRDALRDMGIEDELLIDLLLRDLGGG